MTKNELFNSLVFNGIIYIVLFVFFASSCNRKQDIIQEYPRYNEMEAYKYLTSDPDRMLQILDSAMIVNHMNPEIAEFCKAQCYYMSNRKDTALIIVEKLLDGYRCNKVKEFRADVLVFKTQIESAQDNKFEMSKTAEEASAICHEIGGDYLIYAADMDSKIGAFLVSIGKEKEGFEKISEAIATIREPKTIDELQSLCNCYKRKITSLNTIDSLNIVPTLCDNILQQLNSFEERGIQDAEPEVMSSFIDHSTGSILCYKAVALSKLGDYYRAKEILEECLMTNWSKRQSSAIQLLEIYANLGMYKEFYDACEIIEKNYNFKETLDIYIKVLKCKAKVEKDRGNDDECLKLYKDLIDAQAEINKTSNREEMSKAYALYEVDITKQKAHESEMQNSRLKIILLISLLVFVVLGTITFKLLLKRRKNEEQTQTIIEMHKTDDETADSESTNEEKTMKLMSTLYSKIMELMLNSKPYTNPNFDITQLAAELATNKSYVSRAINRIEGKNFRTWLAEYRNNIIVKKLCEYPDVSITELCDLSGYANRETLSRHFKMINNITISEFKEQLKRNNA